MVDPQPQLLGPGQLALTVQVAVELRVAQRRFERLDLLPVGPGEGLLDSGQGPPHLSTIRQVRERGRGRERRGARRSRGAQTRLRDLRLGSGIVLI